MPTVLGEEPAPIMHAGAGHAVVDHEQKQCVVQPSSGAQFVDDAADILVHAIDNGRVECHLEVKLVAQLGVVGFPLGHIRR